MRQPDFSGGGSPRPMLPPASTIIRVMPEAADGGHRLVHRKALGDAAQIESHAGLQQLDGVPAGIEPQEPVSHLVPRGGDRCRRGQLPRPPGIAPEQRQRPNGNVERPLRPLRQLAGTDQYGPKVVAGVNRVAGPRMLAKLPQFAAGVVVAAGGAELMEPAVGRLGGRRGSCIIRGIEYNPDWHGHFGLRDVEPDQCRRGEQIGCQCRTPQQDRHGPPPETDPIAAPRADGPRFFTPLERLHHEQVTSPGEELATALARLGGYSPRMVGCRPNWAGNRCRGAGQVEGHGGDGGDGQGRKCRGQCRQSPGQGWQHRAIAPPDLPPPTDPTLEVTVKWLPKPVPNKAAEAKDQAGMKPYTEMLVNTDVTFEMAPIPGGVYKMGSPASEKDRKADEGPQVEVKIEPFWMGRHEVTWDEYALWGLGLDSQRRGMTHVSPTHWDNSADALAIPTKPYADMTFGMGKQGYPAICMTQFAAKMYCKWLSAKTGRYYRLPTEAEWEYACRAGTKTAYSFGDDPTKLGDYAWFSDNSDEKYHKVGQKKPNRWGLYDMHGNVCQWCLDQYVVDQYQRLGKKPVVNPVVPVTQSYPQVARGGAWTDEAPALRSAARRASCPEWKAADPQIPKSIWYYTDANFVGFRVVRRCACPASKKRPATTLPSSKKTSISITRNRRPENSKTHGSLADRSSLRFASLLSAKNPAGIAARTRFFAVLRMTPPVRPISQHQSA